MKRNLSKKFISEFCYRLTVLVILAALLILNGCDDFLEEDISDDLVFLLAPADSVTFEEGSTILFSWDFLEGATNYQVQIVTPDFDAPAQLMLDSVTTNNSISAMLSPGQYEWGVSAFNNGYSTNYSIGAFTVSEVADFTDLSDETVNLLGPSGVINQNEVVFVWDELEGADNYELQLVSPGFDNIQQLLYDTTTTSSIITLEVPAGSYSWRLRATNDTSRTNYVVQNFEVSVKEMQQIRLTSPATDYRTNESLVGFSWEPLEDVDFYVIHLDGPGAQQTLVQENNASLAVTGGDGEYRWYVTATLNDRTTVDSDTLTFNYLSGLAPAPVAIRPLAGAVTGDAVTIEWNRLLDSVLGDSVYLYNDANELLPGYPIFSTNGAHSEQITDAGDYQWQVRTVDNEGRAGALSELISFQVQ